MQRFDTLLAPRICASLRGISADEFVGFLRPKCERIIPEARLEEQLREGRALRVKFGIDPTAATLHFGHMVPILLLRLFQLAGHEIDIVIGDFTARIGDPSGRDVGRVPLSVSEIDRNKSAFREQIGRFIGLGDVNFHHNADWLSGFSLSEVFAILERINLAEAMQREDFRARARNGEAVSLAEACYGVLMGLDSVHLRSDIELGGQDQLLNFQQCRHVMRIKGIPEESILMTPILEGTRGDGAKMSKSSGNTIPVSASLSEKFGLIMSIPDQLILSFFRCFSMVHERELDGLRRFVESEPHEAKKQLATLVIAAETKAIDQGLREREEFERKFAKREIEEGDCIALFFDGDPPVFDVLMGSGKFGSRGELRRLFQGNAVRRLEGEFVLRPDASAQQAVGKLRVGRRLFFDLRPKVPA